MTIITDEHDHIVKSFKTVPDLHLDWNNYRNNRLRILHFVQDESSFYLLIYNEFDPGCQVQPRHPDWNLQTLPLSWNRFSLRLLKYPKWSLVNKSGKLTNIGEKWETKLWFVIITCKFARISLNNISYGYLWCLTIEIIITIYWNIIRSILRTTVIRTRNEPQTSEL